MKSNTNDTPAYLRYIIMCILGILFTIFACTAQPTQSNKTEWVELNSTEIPSGLEIYSGITKTGNPKYWFNFDGIKVFISPINKEHYINNTKTILLVEWYNKSTNRYKYTTRQKKECKQSKRIDLEKI